MNLRGSRPAAAFHLMDLHPNLMRIWKCPQTAQKKPPRVSRGGSEERLGEGVALFLGGGVALSQFFGSQLGAGIAKGGDFANFLGDFLADANGRRFALQVAGADGAVAGPDNAFSDDALFANRLSGFKSVAGESGKREASECQSGDCGTEHGRTALVRGCSCDFLVGHFCLSCSLKNAEHFVKCSER